MLKEMINNFVKTKNVWVARDTESEAAETVWGKLFGMQKINKD